MATALLAIKLISLLIIGCLGPGVLFVRRLHWTPLEKLNGAIAISLIATYLASFVLYYFNAQPQAYMAVSAVFAVIGFVNWRQSVVFLSRRVSMVAIFSFLIILAWDSLHLAMARHYGGGTWGNDWQEHYDRMTFFLDHQLPNDYLFLGTYSVPARPPMMNLIAAFYCRQVGASFEAFSLVFLVLNALAVIPCCMLLRLFGRPSRWNVMILTILFMLNPSIVQNATFAWTKSLTAGFVVMGIAFYLRGLQTQSTSRFCAAFLSLAAGILVHYSALPFVVAILVHYFVMLVSGRAKLRTLFAGGIPALGLLATWFGWSISVYGARTTFLANTTATSMAGQTAASAAGKIFFNLFTTLVPHPFHTSPRLVTSSPARDSFFMMSQTTLPMMIGCTAGIVTILLLVRFFRDLNPRFRQDKLFWAIFVPISFVLGVAVNGQREPFGAGHVTLQPLAMIGITFLASRLTQISWLLFSVVLAGAAIDYSLGIFLHFAVRSHIYPPVGDAQVWFSQLLSGSRGNDQQQFATKLVRGFTFWGDHLSTLSPGLKIISIFAAIIGLGLLVRPRVSRY